jgi:hypothetical protein
MTLAKAINLLIDEYELAQNLEFVKNPIAYALYKVWKLADGERKTNE